MIDTTNQTDILCFFANSADKAPGKGVCERVANPTDYTLLATIPHWRRMFSSHWVWPFEVRCKTYRTHAHAFQAAKFETAGRSDVANLFSVESGSTLGTASSGLDADRARKMVILGDTELAAWETERAQAKDEIYLAKFSTDHCKRALLATGDAELWNRGPRIRTLRNLRLENVRFRLRSLL